MPNYYMVVHQVAGMSNAHTNTFVTREDADAMFEACLNDGHVSSAWLDVYTAAGRETVAIYNNKNAIEQIAKPAASMAADGAAAPVLASPFASAV